MLLRGQDCGHVGWVSDGTVQRVAAASVFLAHVAFIDFATHVMRDQPASISSVARGLVVIDGFVSV